MATNRHLIRIKPGDRSEHNAYVDSDAVVSIKIGGRVFKIKPSEIGTPTNKLVLEGGPYELSIWRPNAHGRNDSAITASCRLIE